MKDELLKNGDYNVIVIDWSSGSNFPYTQATANTRVVGAEIAKLIKTLQVGSCSVTASKSNRAVFLRLGYFRDKYLCNNMF